MIFGYDGNETYMDGWMVKIWRWVWKMMVGGINFFSSFFSFFSSFRPGAKSSSITSWSKHLQQSVARRAIGIFLFLFFWFGLCGGGVVLDAFFVVLRYFLRSSRLVRVVLFIVYFLRIIKQKMRSTKIKKGSKIVVNVLSVRCDWFGWLKVSMCCVCAGYRLSNSFACCLSLLYIFLHFSPSNSQLAPFYACGVTYP